jgi:hypothetical protein
MLFYNTNPSLVYSNPVAMGSTALAVAVVGGSAAVGWFGARALLKPKEPPTPAIPVAPKERADPAIFTGVYSSGATIAESKFILSELKLPYAFTVFPITESIDNSPTQSDFPLLTRVGAKLAIRPRAGDPASGSESDVPLLWLTAKTDGAVAFRIDIEAMLAQGVGTDIGEIEKSVTFADGTGPGALRQVGRLVTDLSPVAAELAWEGALYRAHKQDNLAEPGGSLDDCTRYAITVIDGTLAGSQIGKFDWSKSPSNLELNTLEHDVWSGIQFICQLAYQTLWNKQTK